nr:hypothetical protein [Tanacetum cinerariifolium]
MKKTSPKTKVAMEKIREIVPQLTLAGPTSFAPVIEQAMTILEKCGGQYHVLLIIADRQVGNVTLQNKSVQEKKMVDAIVQASKLPLSIVLVGFVNFIEIMSKNVPLNRKEAEFALSSLMEVPSQYKATIELNLLGCRRGNMPQRVARPPIRGPSSQTLSMDTPNPLSRSIFPEVAYPKGEVDDVSIGKRDVDMLLPDTFVNDTIIGFYIKEPDTQGAKLFKQSCRETFGEDISILVAR